MDKILISAEKQIHNTEFSVHHAVTKGWTPHTPFHFHEEYELLLSLTEGLAYNINGNIYTVNKNELILLSPSDFHGTHVSSDILYDRWIVFFKSDFIKDFIATQKDLLDCFISADKACKILKLSDKEAFQLIDLYNKAQQCLEKEEYGYRLYRKMILAEILLFINKLSYQPEKHKSPFEFETNQQLTLMIDYIYKNISEPLQLEQLASKFNMSKSYLCSSFKKVTGTSVHKFINSVRLMKAQDLLEKGYSVTDTCFMVGFSDLSNFIRMFRQEFGKSPKSFIKILK